MYRRILVPLDGSALSEAALAHLANLCGPETEVILLRVVPPVSTDLPPVAVTPYPPGGGSAVAMPPDLRKIDTVPPPNDRNAEEAREYLDERAASLRGVAAKRQTLVLEDVDPSAVIAGQARDAAVDLLLMSTHGRSGVVRWVLGSVAEKVLRSTHVPILLIRPGQPTA